MVCCLKLFDVFSMIIAQSVWNWMANDKSDTNWTDHLYLLKCECIGLFSCFSQYTEQQQQPIFCSFHTNNTQRHCLTHVLNVYACDLLYLYCTYTGPAYTTTHSIVHIVVKNLSKKKRIHSTQSTVIQFILLQLFTFSSIEFWCVFHQNNFLVQFVRSIFIQHWIISSSNYFVVFMLLFF